MLTSIWQLDRASLHQGVDMTYLEIIYYVGGGCAALIVLFSVCYWAVNVFVKQITAGGCEQYRRWMVKESEHALRVFKESLCEQIALQGIKLDAVSKLYAMVVDLLRVGKELAAVLGKGEIPLAQGRLKAIEAITLEFADLCQKQSLHLSDEVCARLDGFVTELKSVTEGIATSLSQAGKEAADGMEIRQRWLQFEDRISEVMDLLKNEFRRGRASPNVMMKWLNEVPPPKSSSSSADAKATTL
jgi:hypothetical protein